MFNKQTFIYTNILDNFPIFLRGNNLDQVVGKAPEQQNLRDELSDLSAMEEALDELIKNCAHQIFELIDDKENAKYPFNSCIILTHGFDCMYSCICKKCRLIPQVCSIA